MAVSQDVREDGPGNVYVNLNDGSGNPIGSVSGGINVNIVTNSSSNLTTAVLTQPVQSASTAVLLALNLNRKGFIIENNATALLYLAFAATASTAAYTRKLQPNAAYEGPNWIYTGAISGIWAATGTGHAIVTEVTP